MRSTATRYAVTFVIGFLATGFAVLPGACATSEAAPVGPSTQPEPLQPDQQSRVYFKIPLANEIIRLRTHFTVPAQPAEIGTLFLWPGLEPRAGGRNYDPIGLGVLQPVLTWGDACAPTPQPPTYSTWWISAQYVNVGNDPDYSGCKSGQAMSVNVGDPLDIDMTLNQTTGVWTQTVTGPAGSVDYSINMSGQAQNQALFAIEPWDGARSATDTLTFSDTTITFRDPDENSCRNPELSYTGTGGRITQPQPGTGGSCHIDTVTVNSPSLDRDVAAHGVTR